MKPILLPNGIPTYILPAAGTDAATLLVLLKVGSRYESSALNGASHFIEHMMFKGTKRRPLPEDFSRALDAVGAEYNAYTGKDVTGYWVKVGKNHLSLAVDVLYDMLTDSQFPKAAMDRERKVIMEEINMYHENPMMRVEELLEQVMFPGNTLGWDIAGSHETMTKMSRKDVMQFRDAYYTADRMVIAAAGAVPSTLKPLLAKTFGCISKAKSLAGTFEPFSGQSSKKISRVILQKKEVKQAQVVLGFPGFGYGDERLPALRLLSVILGGPMSSRLFSEVREKRGLCYFVRSSLSPYEGTGLFTIHSGLDASRLKVAGATIMRETRKLTKDLVSKEELDRAKEYVIGKTILGLEDSAERAEWFAKQHLYGGSAQTPEERFETTKRVTAMQIRAVAREVFDLSKMGVAAIGPFASEKVVRSYFV